MRAGSVRWERPASRSFWDSLADPERLALAASGMPAEFRAGSLLCRQGDESSQVMIIGSGWVKVSVPADDVRAGGVGEQIIAVRGPGDVVGERAALVMRARSANVTALDEVRALVVTAERFVEFLVGHPRAAEVLERQERERREEDRARQFPGEPTDGERRLAWLLVELAQRRGGAGQDSPALLTLPMSQQELADWADVSLDAVGRFVRSWRERGIVLTDRRQVSVVDLDALVAISGTYPAGHEIGAGTDGGEGQLSVAQRGQGAGGADMALVQMGGPLDSILKSSLNCSIFVTDVAGFGTAAQSDDDRQAVRSAMYDILRSSFDESGVPWTTCYREDRGDGAVIVVPPTIATARVVDPLLSVLAAKLRRYNRRGSHVVRIQLRAALHVGRVGQDAEGLTGQGLRLAARILDAPVLMEKLRDTGADLVFAASQYVYDHLISHSKGRADPARFERVQYQVKKSRVTAWIQLVESGAARRNDSLAVSGTAALPAEVDDFRAQIRDKDAALAAIGYAALALLQAASERLDYSRPSDWPAWRRLVPLMTALLRRLGGWVDGDSLARLVTISDQAANALSHSGDLTAAHTLVRSSVTVADRLGREHPANQAARHTLAAVIARRGWYGEAEDLYTQVLADQRRLLGNDDPAIFSTRRELATAIADQGRYREAEAMYRQLLADQRRVLGEDHPDTLGTRHRLGWVLAWQDRRPEAEALYRQLLADQRRVLGEDHPDTLGTRQRLGWVVTALGRYGEAEALYRQLLADQRRVLGEDHPDTLGTRQRLGWVVTALGRYGEAEALYRQLLADQRRVLGDDHPSLRKTRYRLARGEDPPGGRAGTGTRALSGGQQSPGLEASRRGYEARLDVADDDKLPLRSGQSVTLEFTYAPTTAAAGQAVSPSSQAGPPAGRAEALADQIDNVDLVVLVTSPHAHVEPSLQKTLLRPAHGTQACLFAVTAEAGIETAAVDLRISVYRQADSLLLQEFTAALPFAPPQTAETVH